MEQVLINGVVLSVNYALVALGITLIFGILGILNFAHGQMFMIGGFMVYYVYAVFGWPYLVALATAAVVVGLIGVAFELLFFRRVLRIAKREENSMLLAVGTALLLENIALFAFGEKQRGVPPLIGGVYRIGNAFLPAGRLLVLVLSIVLIVALLLFVQYTKPGRAMRALAQDREATLLMGVNVDRISALGFGIGAMLAGLAGGLLITISAVNAGIGTVTSIKAFIMIMIGGAGVVAGAILGAIVLGFAEAIGYALIPGSTTYLLIFVGLILFLIIRPQGIMGKPWG
ncbi:MAG TPA: branched-chain amino acid ABC transporter permease [Geminicoccaceae bacterium]|jgi:branched-chain amino acid transport system permease protein|nr:branched-chain amino acid ABC transporter permease [Geminicoccaceae bacterium]